MCDGELVMEPIVDVEGVFSVKEINKSPFPIYEITLSHNFLEDTWMELKQSKIKGDQFTVTVVGAMGGG